MMVPHLSGTFGLIIVGVALLGFGVGYALNRIAARMSQTLLEDALHGETMPLSVGGRSRRLVPLVCAVLSALLAGRYGLEWKTLWCLLLLWALLTLVLIDLDTLLLPDRLTLPLLWGGLLINSFGALTDLQSAVWGAMMGYLLLWAVYWLYWWITHREGLGYGDFKLLAGLGAWFGWQALPPVLLLASFTGVVTGLFWLWRGGYSRHTPMAFGPFLAAAGYGVMLWGEGGLP
ncbi:MAG: prepilin peptidase [Betaproteobacteria bacterium]|nr:prepilin peptidase [Betaproteobacteria bacterium]